MVPSVQLCEIAKKTGHKFLLFFFYSVKTPLSAKLRKKKKKTNWCGYLMAAVSQATFVATLTVLTVESTLQDWVSLH